jgi:hypothetical protein
MASGSADKQIKFWDFDLRAVDAGAGAGAGAGSGKRIEIFHGVGKRYVRLHMLDGPVATAASHGHWLPASSSSTVAASVSA